MEKYVPVCLNFQFKLYAVGLLLEESIKMSFLLVIIQTVLILYTTLLCNYQNNFQNTTFQKRIFMRNLLCNMCHYFCSTHSCPKRQIAK